MNKLVFVILKKRKYLVIASFSFVVMSLLLYYLTVVNIYKNSIFRYASMSGMTFTIFSLTLSLLTAILFGIYLSLLVFKKDISKKISVKSGATASFGSVAGVVATGCPSCGIPLLGFIGLPPLAMMALPFEGLEIKFLGVLLLIVSIYFVLKSIQKSLYCKI